MRPRRRWRVLLAVVLAAVVAAPAYLLWQAVQAEQQRLQQAIQELQAQQTGMHDQVQDALASLTSGRAAVDAQAAALQTGLTDQQQALQRQSTELQAQTERLRNWQQGVEQREAELLQQLARTQAELGRQGSDWLVAEAAYLVRIAAHRLRLLQDPDTAIAALQLAAQRLRETGEAAWLPARTQLNTAITAITAQRAQAPLARVSRLSALQAAVPSLALQGEQAPRYATAAATAGTADTATEAPGLLPRLAADLLAGVAGLIRVEHRGQPVAGTLQLADQGLRRDQLSLHLQLAQLALLRDRPTLYTAAIAAADRQLTLAFAEEEPAVRRFREDLQALADMPLPVWPDLGIVLGLLTDRASAGLPAPGSAAQVTDRPAR